MEDGRSEWCAPQSGLLGHLNELVLNLLLQAQAQQLRLTAAHLLLRAERDLKVILADRSER